MFSQSWKIFLLANSSVKNFNEIFSWDLLMWFTLLVQHASNWHLKLSIKTPERRHWCRSDVFIVNFEQILHCSGVAIVNFEQVNVGWEDSILSTLEFTSLYGTSSFTAASANSSGSHFSSRGYVANTRIWSPKSM